MAWTGIHALYTALAFQATVFRASGHVSKYFVSFTLVTATSCPVFSVPGFNHICCDAAGLLSELQFVLSLLFRRIRVFLGNPCYCEVSGVPPCAHSSTNANQAPAMKFHVFVLDLCFAQAVLMSLC